MLRSRQWSLSLCVALLWCLICQLSLFSQETQKAVAQRLGVVSYTYRNQFQKDVPGTLDRIKSLGIRDIEFSNLFGYTAVEIRRLLDERGMTCSSFGVSYEDALAKTDEVAGQAKTLGASFVRVAWIPHKAPFTIEIAKKAAADFDRIGKRLRETHGLIFCYHNHGYEFVPNGEATLFDLLMSETSPDNLSVELDVLWAHLPGASPVALLNKYGNRIKLIHLKDLKKGVPTGDLSGKTDSENDVALGTGQIDIKGICEAAIRADVKHLYIEDESSAIAKQVPESLEFLSQLK